MNDVFYLSSSPALAEAVVAQYELQGYDFYDYVRSNRPFNAGIVLIISPINIQNQWINYTKLWKNYLETEVPNSQLVVLSFDKTTNPIMGDLLNLPLKFSAFLSKSVDIQNRDFFKYNSYYQSNIEAKLQRFFEGHGKESVMEVLYKLMRKLHLVERELRIGEWTFDQAIAEYFESDYTYKEWVEFRKRWNSYFEFFVYTPFCEIFAEINQKIKHISPFFDEKCEREDLFLNLECWKHLQYICDKLVKIREMSGKLLNNSTLMIQ